MSRPAGQSFSAVVAAMGWASIGDGDDRLCLRPRPRRLVSYGDGRPTYLIISLCLPAAATYLPTCSPARPPRKPTYLPAVTYSTNLRRSRENTKRSHDAWRHASRREGVRRAHYRQHPRALLRRAGERCPCAIRWATSPWLSTHARRSRAVTPKAAQGCARAALERAVATGVYCVEAVREHVAQRDRHCSDEDGSAATAQPQPRGGMGYEKLPAGARTAATAGRATGWSKHSTDAWRTAQRCAASRLLHSSLPTSPPGFVTGPPFLSPRTSRPCTGPGALGAGVWVRQACTTGHAVPGFARLRSVRPRSSTPATARCLDWRAPGERPVRVAPLECAPRARQAALRRSPSTAGRRRGSSLARRASARRGRGVRRVVREPGGWQSSFGAADVRALVQRVLKGSNRAPLLVVAALCGSLAPTTLTTGRVEGADGRASCAALGKELQSSAAGVFSTIMQAHPIAAPYPPQRDDSQRADVMRYKYHGARGFLGVDFMLDEFSASMQSGMGSQVAAVLPERQMSASWWDLLGDGLHWEIHVPPRNKWFMANVARALMHFVTHGVP